MGIFSGMNDKTAPRAFPWIWFIRIVQLIITGIVIALSGLEAYSWRTCSVPGKIAWNLACAVITLPVLVYFILSTGPAKIFKLLPWLIWGQLALDALMFVFWTAAAGASKLTCNDYCNACPDWPTVFSNDLECRCFYIYKRDMSPAPQGLGGLLEPRRTYRSRNNGNGGTVAARTAMNAIMTLLFFLTLVATIWWIFTQRRSTGTAAPTIPPPTQPEAGNAGFPMTSSQQPATGYGPQVGGQYPQGQPQPHQPVYDPSNPQGQYPTHAQPMTYQAGAPAQY